MGCLAQDLKETEVIQISNIMMDRIQVNRWSELLTIVNHAARWSL